MTAITVQQMTPLQTTNMGKFVIDTAVRESPIFRRLMFEQSDALSMIGPYLANIPTPTYRHVNEAGSEISADFAQIAYALSIMDNDIKIDPVLNRVGNVIQNTRRAQIEESVKAVAYLTVDKFFNGDITSNAREPEGIKRRLGEDLRFSGQTQNATANSTELNLAVGTAADADYRTFFHKINQAMSLINLGGGLPKDGVAIIATNWNALLTLEAAAKQLRLYNVNQDQYSREFQEYKGFPILDAGWTPAGAVAGSFPAGGVAGDLIIGNDSEAVTTTNGGFAYDKQTPIYFIRLGDRYTAGLQMGPMQTIDHGQQTASPHYYIYQILWVNNPAVFWQKRAASRLVGCNFSGVTS